ncbi:hypothetical protein [Streptomyces sp. NPDC001388]|uniref:hypothetical protein n=1 Tax=unclassified Streptomyces TaxID=2593676 RepID=UPI0036B99BFF
MPAERHEKPEGYDGTDPLMAAITGDPLPEEMRADPALLAAHRSAAADVALLREQLGLVAEALTRPVEEPAPARARPPRPTRRRLRPLALRAVGAAAAGALVFGAGWVVVQVGQGTAGVESSSDSGAKAASGAEDAGSPLGDPGYLACVRLVVEGDVTAVDPVPGTDEERVTLRVTRAYTPERTQREVRFVLARDMDPLVAEGDHVLVALPKGSSSPDVWAVGEAGIAAERDALARALPDAEGVSCT